MAIDTTIWAFAGLVVLTIGALAAAWLAVRHDDTAVRRLRAAAAGSGLDLPILARSLGNGAAAGEGELGEGASRLRQQLVWAGFRRPRAPQLFLVAKIALSGGAVAAFAAINATRAQPFDMALPLAVWAGGVGFYFPNLWLRGRVARRQTQLDRSLPDALDLLVTCVEAGLGLDAALQRVADEIALAHPLLSSELRQVFLEIKAGIGRIPAFRRMAARTGSAELRALSATLAQTEMFGTSIGSALRVQAESIRIRRMQRAEEKAAYVAVKMTLPLVVCILPSLIAIVVGPAVVGIINTLPGLGGR